MFQDLNEKICNRSGVIEQDICIGLTVLQQVSTLPVTVKGQEYMEHTALKFASACLGYLMRCRFPGSADKK